MSDKPKCPVFGCTIPRGIPHEHPAGVSAVMRDPAGPLDADERAELEALRAKLSAGNAVFLGCTPEQFQDLQDMQSRQNSTLSVESRLDAPIEESLLIQKATMPENPMTGGRKLRDALLMAGHNDRLPAGMQQGNSFADVIDQRRERNGIDASEFTEARRLSVVQIACRIATGIVLATGVALILILSAMNAGWL